jgi:hypothetical protein
MPRRVSPSPARRLPSPTCDLPIDTILASDVEALQRGGALGLRVMDLDLDRGLHCLARRAMLAASVRELNEHRSIGRGP